MEEKENTVQGYNTHNKHNTNREIKHIDKQTVELVACCLVMSIVSSSSYLLLL